VCVRAGRGRGESVREGALGAGDKVMMKARCTNSDACTTPYSTTNALNSLRWRGQQQSQPHRHFATQHSPSTTQSMVLLSRKLCISARRLWIVATSWG
jgi:hypothetical protein